MTDTFFFHLCGYEIQMAALWGVWWNLDGSLFQDSSDILHNFRVPSVQELCENNFKVGKPDLLRTSVPWADIYISPSHLNFYYAGLIPFVYFWITPIFPLRAKKIYFPFFFRYLVLSCTTYFEVKMAPSILCIGSWWSTFSL